MTGEIAGIPFPLLHAAILALLPLNRPVTPLCTYPSTPLPPQTLAAAAALPLLGAEHTTAAPRLCSTVGRPLRCSSTSTDQAIIYVAGSSHTYIQQNEQYITAHIT